MGAKGERAPVRAGDVLEVELSGIAHDGRGVGRVPGGSGERDGSGSGFTLFVRGGLPGERVRARVTRVAKGYASADLAEIVRPSPDRTEPRCPVYGSCGGCQLQHAGYRWQLEAKARRVAEALERIGKFPVVRAESGAAPPEGEAGQRAVRVLPPVGAADPWRYRNKIYAAVEERDGGLAIGFYAPESRNLVPAEDCWIADERLVRLLRAGREAARRCGWTADPAGTRAAARGTGGTGGGLLRHLAARLAPGTGQTMLIAVVATDRPPGQRDFAAAVREQVPDVTSIVLNVRPGPPGGPVFGRRSRTLFGPERLVDRLGGMVFEISPTSFYQVNAVQAEELYRLAVEAAGLTGREFVVDAYCGVGTISLFLARRAARVVGIEAVPEAVEDARRNARLNGIRNAEFRAGAVEDVLPVLAAERRPDVVVLDPPRRGCDRSVLRAVSEARVPRVVYVSCDPATLARDLRMLAGCGYRVREVRPVDLFPQTGHVESVALLTRE
ncbi:MAG: 23S rRNA (uracil(1939)-C(5))-methyltransferase RlmD [Alicyclobacillaceae bacterium]|nr:23S rRNA (uracil(1939)-C(5))-methyltransferase RlmD [Alicyclobacillaceae bacterium]